MEEGEALNNSVGYTLPLTSRTASSATCSGSLCAVLAWRCLHVDAVVNSEVDEVGRPFLVLEMLVVYP